MPVTIDQITEKLKLVPQEVLDRMMGYLDAITLYGPIGEIPQWHKEIIDRRLKDYKQNPENVSDLDTFLDELEKQL